MWKISATNIKLDELTQAASVRDGRAAVFGDARPRLMVRFGRLDADVRSRRLRASGGIAAESADTGTRFSAADIVVDLRTNTVRASGPVSGTNPAGAFNAGSLSADLKFSRIVLSGGVSGRIAPRGAAGR